MKLEEKETTELLDKEVDRLYSTERQHWWTRTRRKLILYLIEKYHLSHTSSCVPSRDTGRRMLDIGCGTGFLLEALSSHYAIYGIDISPVAVDICRRKGLTEVRKGDACNLDFPERDFDLITALDVFEHILEDEEAMAQCYRIMRKNGLIFITVPACVCLWSEHDEALGHRRRYRKDEFQKKLQKAGFSVMWIGYFNSLLFLPIFLTVRLRKLTGGWPRFTKKTDQKPSLAIVRSGLNAILETIFNLELRLIKGGVRFPVGVSLVAVARKGA